MKKMMLAGTQKEPTQLELNNRTLAREAAAEGFVLLENDGVLPLKKKRIALYGSGARRTVKGGTGSGAVRERYSVSIEEGLKNAGIEITTEAWLDRFDKFYEDAYEEYRQGVEKKVEGIRDFFKILGMAGQFHHPTGIPVEDADIENSGTDTAIYVLCRQAGEGFDRKDEKGDYRLDDLELANLMKASEGYQNLIVVVNVGGMIDLSFLDTLHVSALVYFSQGGEEGGSALADVLTGKKNFSGKLTASWAKSFDDIPSNSTYSYLGEDAHNQEYNEGIYVGYRFYDTFGKKPRYPFGYGLSYTEFALTPGRFAQNGRKLSLKVMMENTGDAAGKEVAQLYVQVPFGTAGAEAKRLVAFAKTKELKSGEKQELKLEFPVDALAKYQEEKARFVLEAGEYVFLLGNSSENTKPVLYFTLENEIVTEQCTNVCQPRHEIAEIQPPAREKIDLAGVLQTELEKNAITTVTHQYHTPEADGVSESVKQLAETMSLEELALLACGAGTSAKDLLVNATGASGSTTAGLFEKYGIPNVILSDGPQGLNLTTQVVELPDGDLRAANVPETIEAYKRYFFGFAKIALQSQMAKTTDGIVHYQYATAWPCSQLLAQSFDVSLMEQVGDAVGKEMEAYGVTVWLAPGMNIQRNPLCGRNFEYYSEDPVVSGKLAAAIVRGVQKHPGKGMSIKHFAANNCELERNSSSSNMTERTLRELYLRGFEIAVKESEPMTVMASYNLINGVYNVNGYDLLVKVLRNEWGFKGLVMSDWDAITCEAGEPMKARTGDVLQALTAQCDLVMPGRPDQVEALIQGVKEGKVSMHDLKRSAARILSMVEVNTACEMEIKQKKG